MMLDVKALRDSPQLAAIELLIQAADTTVVALCAAHPALDHDLRPDPEPVIDGLLIASSTASPACATAFSNIADPWTTSSDSDETRATMTTTIPTSKPQPAGPTLRPLRARSVGLPFPSISSRARTRPTPMMPISQSA